MEWRLKDQQTYETLNTTGTLKRLQEELISSKKNMRCPEVWICQEENDS
jgi:hypothetical protein